MTDQLFSEILKFLPAVGTLVVVMVLIKCLNLLAAKRQLSPEYRRTLVPQFVVVVTAVVGVLVIVLVLPISDTARGQVLGLFGVVFTGIVALSSTTFVTNALAGLMLRLIRNYKAGDFICVDEKFGRITERGLFHTEIQTEDRDLTTFPNLFLITNPLTVVRSSGTIISANLSLGYDVSHKVVEPLLVEAATRTGLKDPFVQLMELGDFSVTYKISGFLSETKQLLAMRSNLKRAVLNVLHAAGIEIVSPNFMNQRVLSRDAAMIPESVPSFIEQASDAAPLPESIIFDKAEIAEEVDLWRDRLAAYAKKRDLLQKSKDKSSADALERVTTAIEKIEKRLEKYNQLLNADENGDKPKG